jgi:hypothetical protein
MALLATQDRRKSLRKKSRDAKWNYSGLLAEKEILWMITKLKGVVSLQLFRFHMKARK